MDDKEHKSLLGVSGNCTMESIDMHVRKEQFFSAIEFITKSLNSHHPYDKAIIQEFIQGGMTKEEVKQFRDLTLKAAKTYYGQKEKN